jgi:hypothetical protein
MVELYDWITSSFIRRGRETFTTHMHTTHAHTGTHVCPPYVLPCDVLAALGFSWQESPHQMEPLDLAVPELFAKISLYKVACFSFSL